MKMTHVVQGVEMPLDFDEGSAGVLFGSISEARAWAQALKDSRTAQMSGLDRVEIQSTLFRALVLGGVGGDQARRSAPHLLRIQTSREVELILADVILASLPSA